MEQSPSREVTTHSANQEIPYLKRNLKVHYRVHKSSSIVPILSQMNSVHNFTPCFFKIHFNMNFKSMLGSPVWSLSIQMALYKIVWQRFVHCPLSEAHLIHTRRSSSWLYLSSGDWLSYHWQFCCSACKFYYRVSNDSLKNYDSGFILDFIALLTYFGAR